MARKGRVRPFALVTNEQGIDEDSGVYYIQPSAAELIENFHYEAKGEFTTDKIGYEPLNAKTCSANATTDTITCQGHPFTNGQIISFDSSGSLPGGITTTATLYAGNSTTDTFQVFTDAGLTQLLDITSAGSGTIKVAGALESGTQVDSLHWYTDTSGMDYILEKIGSKVKNINPDTGAVTSEICTTLTAGNKADFATFNGNVYMAEGSVSPLQWSGTGNMTAVSNFPIDNTTEKYDKPTIVEPFANRIIWGGFQGGTLSGVASSFKSHIVISNNLLADTFTFTTGTDTNAIALAINPGDGQNLVTVKSLFVPYTGQTIAVCFKERSVYQLTGTKQSNFSVQKINEGLGALNKDCVIQVGNDLVFMDQNTITSLSSATDNGTIQTRELASQNIRKTLKKLNISQKDLAWGMHIPDRREILFGIPTGASTKVDTVLVYHYPDINSQDEAGIWTVRTGSNPSCALMFKKTFMTGSCTGYLNVWFNSSKYWNASISFTYRYPYFDFGSLGQYKQIHKIYAVFFNQAVQSVTFTSQWRGGGNRDKKAITKSVTIGQGGAVFGATIPPGAIFGTDVFGDLPLKSVPLPCYGNGDQWRFELKGTNGESGIIFAGVHGLLEYGNLIMSYR